MTPRNHRLLLGLAGLLLFSGVAVLRGLGDLAAQVPAMWGALLVTGVGYGLAVWLVVRRGARRRDRTTTAILLAGAVAVRLLLLDTPPSLSDDIYRYVWDGRVGAADINPYAHAPADDALSALRDANWARINHRELVTVYPPVAQLLFRAAGAVWAGVTGLKAALVLCELLLIGVLWRWLRDRGQDPHRVVVYAWHPLPVVEIAGNGHVDILALLWLCAGVWLLERNRRHGAALALAAGALAKVIPLLCLPAFWRRWQPRGGWRARLDPRPRATLLWLPLAAIAAWLPFRDAGPAMGSGLRAYASKWRFNDSAYGAVYAAIADPAPGWTWDDGALLTARWLCLGGLALLGLWMALRGRDDPAGTCARLLGAQLLLAPTVHPWYALWVLPWLALRIQAPWLALSGLVFLAYDVHTVFRVTGTWQTSPWVAWVEYAPVYALLLGGPLWRLARHWNGTTGASSA